MQWHKLHEQARFLPKYPAEAAVRFTFGHIPRPSEEFAPVVLDLGCGGGRHTTFLAREGYRAVGSDFSQPALAAAEKVLLAEGLKADLYLADAKDLPFADDFFDAVIAYGSLYYMVWDEMLQAVRELRRVLKPGGSCFIYTRSNMDYRCGKGVKLDARSYILGTSETNEAGMVNCFISAEDIPSLLKGFGSIISERYEFTAGNGTILNSDWAIIATKEV